MVKENLYNYIENPNLLDNDSLQSLEAVTEQYPYFQTARLLLYKNKMQAGIENMEDDLAKTSIFCSDRVRFFYYVNEEKYSIFLKSTDNDKNVDKTLALLDSYLETFSDNRVHEIDNTAYNVVSEDYFAYLEKQENKTIYLPEPDSNENKMQHQDVIDAFLKKASSNELLTISPEIVQKPESTQSKDGEGSEFLTETLAKIYIKQKKYEQALAIIKRLSLNFPKKSVYFADQIRFLEYLILNEKIKNR